MCLFAEMLSVKVSHGFASEKRLGASCYSNQHVVTAGNPAVMMKMISQRCDHTVKGETFWIFTTKMQHGIFYRKTVQLLIKGRHEKFVEFLSLLMCFILRGQQSVQLHVQPSHSSWEKWTQTCAFWLTSHPRFSTSHCVLWFTSVVWVKITVEKSHTLHTHTSSPFCLCEDLLHYPAPVLNYPNQP